MAFSRRPVEATSWPQAQHGGVARWDCALSTGLHCAAGAAAGPAKEIGVNSDSTSSAASTGLVCQPITQPTQQTMQAQAQAQAGASPAPHQQPHGQQILGAAAGEPAGLRQQQLPQTAVAQELTDPLAALAAQLAGKSSAETMLWGSLQQASQPQQQLPRAATAEMAVRGSMLPQQQQQQVRPLAGQQMNALMAGGGLGGAGAQHQQQAGAGAGELHMPMPTLSQQEVRHLSPPAA